MFADSNPWMKGVQRLAAGVTAARRPVAADNPFLALQTKVSEQIITALDAYRDARDKLAGADLLRLLRLAVRPGAARHQRDTDVRPPPGTSPEALAARQAQHGRLCGEAEDRRIRRGADPGGDLRPRGRSDARPALRTRAERCAPAAHATFACRSSKPWCGTSSSCCSSKPDRAVEVLASLVPEADARKDLLKQVRAIASCRASPVRARRENGIA